MLLDIRVVILTNHYCKSISYPLPRGLSYKYRYLA